ncbi:HNH endonuclease [Lysinibacillus sp. LZ02]|uniref:HNH endonuclease n=1 Tax=Lysinibacillus sp. LZ02 TaxID=3420668 RepID=UPI003D3630AC
MDNNPISTEERVLCIVEIIRALGGQAELSQIYASYEFLYPEDTARFKDWHVPIRKAIYEHSSDADIFKGKFDLFYAIEKGKGVWGLRSELGKVKKRPVYMTEEDQFPEGKEQYYLHKKRERNQTVVRLKKQIAMQDGKLNCEVCGFDFKARYGELGEGYIECHHIKPISVYTEEEVTTVDDLVLVCSNCHRMLHRKRPWIGKDELKDILKK